MSIFISEIKYKHHKIELPENRRSHIILTGKNGSGKTQLLTAIKKQLILIENNYFLEGKEYQKEEFINDLVKEILYKNLIDSNNFTSINLENSLEKKVRFEHIRSKKSPRKRYVSLRFNEGQVEKTLQNRINNGFIVAFFDSKRSLSFEDPTGITKSMESKYSIQDYVGSQFIQYLVNLKADRAFAFEENNYKRVQRIDDWFKTLEINLKNLFETNDLSLKFDRKTFNFYLLVNGEKTDFNNLSDGFSSIIFIISEIIMRMSNKMRLREEGVVIIDEVENHLHVSLQKKILSFLTGFFPNIQFVVSTHSPFVLSSIENAIIYDMEKMTTSKNFSNYSYGSILEDYFEIDLYSNTLKKKFDRYVELVNAIEDLSKEDSEDLQSLSNYFDHIPNELAPELKSLYNTYELKRWNE